MSTQIQCENGKVLIEQLEHLPRAGEIIHVEGVDYYVTAEQPVTKLIDLGTLGKKWVPIVKVKRAIEGPTSRGEAVMG